MTFLLLTIAHLIPISLMMMMGLTLIFLKILPQMSARAVLMLTSALLVWKLKLNAAVGQPQSLLRARPLR